MARLTWTDALGTWTLRSTWPGAAGRFQGWEPATRDVGEGEVPIGTGDTHFLRYRTDYGVRFRLEGLRAAAPAEGPAGWTVLDAIDRLTRHLTTRRGRVQVWPENGRDPALVYTCALLAGTAPERTLTDRGLLEYALALQLRNTARAELRYPYGYPVGSAPGEA